MSWGGGASEKREWPCARVGTERGGITSNSWEQSMFGSAVIGERLGGVGESRGEQVEADGMDAVYSQKSITGGFLR